jgi:hypothetical protein
MCTGREKQKVESTLSKHTVVCPISCYTMAIY